MLKESANEGYGCPERWKTVEDAEADKKVFVNAINWQKPLLKLKEEEFFVSPDDFGYEVILLSPGIFETEMFR